MSVGCISWLHLILFQNIPYQLHCPVSASGNIPAASCKEGKYHFLFHPTCGGRNAFLLQELSDKDGLVSQAGVDPGRCLEKHLGMPW